MVKKVRFKLNKKLDKQMAVVFLDVKRGGIDFSNGIFNVHPEIAYLKKILKRNKREEIINKYFDKFYKSHEDYLKKKALEFFKEWNKVETAFIAITDRLFNSYHFPKGQYIGYLSIVDCNPRFLRSKTFQIFYAHPRGVKYVTAHELLHFIFYDYAIKKYPEIFKKLDTGSGIFWDLAEIFNVIVLSLPKFKKLHKQEKVFCYPEHKKYLPELKKLWQRTSNIDNWLIGAYEYLKKREGNFFNFKNQRKRKIVKYSLGISVVY